MRIKPGKPYPLGATWDGMGVNFAIFSESATRVELCLWDGADSSGPESVRVAMPEQTDQVWHVYISDLEPGQLYGYRVYGPLDPARGHRFNPHKVLLDPYAKSIGRPLRWDASLFGYPVGQSDGDLTMDTRDDAAFAPLAAVVDPSFPWEDDKPPHTPWHKTIIYEAHVKGLTRLHPGIQAGHRGTYLALASEPVLKYLKELGITAIELLPVHHSLTEWGLEQKGLRNYWGYHTLGYFAPEPHYTASKRPDDANREFRRMVRALHANGIEVILDVVYNHTAEGNQLGPTLSLRGIDNAAYYRLSPENPRYYMDYTGTGNTLNMSHPRVLQLITDSLRYWVTEMHVDGFRFDLASALARELHEVKKLSAFFDIIHQDPVLSQVKLIAEPWDLGEGGYQVGNFPVGWTEWNGRYRDAIRRFWKGDGGMAGEIATRLSGSSDLYEHSGRRPYASINFVTCHDGFTLRDLVSFNSKHNEANGEGNRDGSDDNASWNCGVEGDTQDPEVRRLRQRQMRNLLATLMFSQGVPMLLAGDEVGHSQGGNNNAYCQDNELTWLSWDLDDEKRDLLAFTQRLIQIRNAEPALRRKKFFQGRPLRGAGVKDISFFRPDGVEMTDEDWTAGHVRCLGVRVVPDLRTLSLEGGEEMPVARTLLLLVNAHFEAIPFTLPHPATGERWIRLVDTADDWQSANVRRTRPVYPLSERSLALLRVERRDGTDPD